MTSGADAWLVDERWFKAYPLAVETTSIGRGSECMIILRDPAVSRHHADVKRESSGYVLRAFGSSGVLVNGIRVGAECALQEGDVVEIAFTTLRFTTKAPTNEMFVIPRDTPTFIDQLEGPTKATLNAMNRSAIMRGTRRYWHVIAMVILLFGLLLFVLATRAPAP
jgi:pSer/pThr/pTyr-binding forkhead associated (FHA) protein